MRLGNSKLRERLLWVFEFMRLIIGVMNAPGAMVTTRMP